MATNNNEILLQVDHLCQYFGPTKAVDDVSFYIKKGEAFGLVGESGCGKTTTGRSIIKLYNITGGNIYFKGIRIGAGTLGYKNAIAEAKKEYKEKVKSATAEEKAKLDEELKTKLDDLHKEMKQAKFDQAHCDHVYQDEQVAAVDAEYSKKEAAVKKKIEELRANGADKAQIVAERENLKSIYAEYVDKRRKAKKTKLVTQIQMIFQDPIASLDPRMTVREIISEGLIIQGERDKKVLDKKVLEMLDLVGLAPEHADRYPHEFSGGQRQRIGVARSIIMNPELIIADEPVSALDVSIQAQVINLLNDLRDRFNLTILFIAHDLSVVKYFSDRIGVMYYGKMVELADSDELFRHPFHPYTRSLLSAIPLPDPEYEKVRKRIEYNPLAEHDYSVDKPVMREVCKGHFVYCNNEEFARYQAQLASENNG